jgi:hypothetical protein
MSELRDEDLDSGTRKLVEDLKAKPFSFDREELLRRARKLRYHSYKSADAMCTVTLIKHLKGAGYHDLAKRAAEDRYEQDREESRKWAEETEEGRRMTALVENDPELRARMDAAMRALSSPEGAARAKQMAREFFDEIKGTRVGRGN